jgi:hypothetical protein
MTLQELKEKLRNAGFHVIHVEDDVDEDNANGLSFCGEFEEYLDSLKALDKKVVFLATHELEEEGFQYADKRRSYSNDDESDAEAEVIDLCLVNSDLAGLKSHIEEIGVYKLFTAMSEDSLNFYFYEDWWLEYIEIWVDVVNDFKAKRIEMLQRMEESKKEKEKEILKSVRQLAKDNSFCGLKTQRAMITYATENIQDVESLDPSILRKEIQILYDKVR